VKDAAVRSRDAADSRAKRQQGRLSRLSLGERALPLALSALAMLGLGISTYLTLTHYAKKSIVCAGLGECDYVNSSQYASVAGIPVSLLGILMYAGLLTAALAWAWDHRSEALPVVYWGMALAGAGYAGYLTYVELGILHAICIWCVASATVLALSLIVSTAALLFRD
jgi:uncharacterized membrane protein